MMDILTHRGDKCYETGLLWKHDKVKIPESYGMTLNRLESLERKLLKNPSQLAAYEAEITKYTEKGVCYCVT